MLHLILYENSQIVLKCAIVNGSIADVEEPKAMFLAIFVRTLVSLSAAGRECAEIPRHEDAIAVKEIIHPISIIFIAIGVCQVTSALPLPIDELALVPRLITVSPVDVSQMR